jgi:hypothetical protein
MKRELPWVSILASLGGTREASVPETIGGRSGAATLIQKLLRPYFIAAIHDNTTGPAKATPRRGASPWQAPKAHHAAAQAPPARLLGGAAAGGA